MSPTAAAVTAFVAWTLALVILMEVIRGKLVLTGEVATSAFTPDNANLSPFVQRLTRVHANCLEGLPIFGGLMLVAMLTQRTAITDPLAYVFLGARLVQSTLHLISIHPTVILMRFSAFSVQLGIGAYWAYRLLLG